MNRTTFQLLTLGLLAAFLPTLAFAQARPRDGRNFAADVRHGFPTGADASPTVAASNVNDYTQQDEQINIDPSDGTVKVLRTDQKMLINDFVTAIVPCKKVNPRELRGPFRVMTRKEGGDADVLQDKEKKENYLQIVCPRFQLPYVEACIAALDEDWVKERYDGTGEMYYKAKFRNIRNIQQVTRWYVGPESFQVDGAQRYVFDDLNNAMYYTDQPALMGLQEWALKQVDIPPNQVNLEVSIYEVDSNNDVMLGLDWASWKNGPGRNLFEFGYFDESAEAKATNLATGERHITNDTNKKFSLAYINATAAAQFFDFVQNKGYVRELVKTNITVKSGSPARIEAVDSVAQFESVPRADTARRTENLVDKDGNPISVKTPTDDPATPAVIEGQRNRLLNYREADDKVGLQVVLTPNVGLESLELDVNVNVSSVAGYTPKGNPILGVRHVNNYVRLIDGQPYVLGGIEREAVVRRKNGFPFLHKLPGLGWLFGGELNAKRNTQIVMIVRPTFVLGAESVLEMPKEAKTVVAQAKGQETIELPSNAFGFDQWLLGTSE